jgi:hypothetical protein
MAKKRVVHDKVSYARTIAIKGTVRHAVKQAALNSPSRVYVDRKGLEKRGGKQKHKNSGMESLRA